MNEVTFTKYAELESVLRGVELVVTDTNVKALYGELLHDAYAIKAGEVNKNSDTLFEILKAMHERGLTRGDTVCAVGGGVVGDITGLAAALYMRGVKYINVPTTLLATIDSSIGGKTAIDFDGVKNLVGAFYPPSAIYICYDFLKTLDRRERLCGVGELIKTCTLTSGAFKALKENFSAVTGFTDGGVDGRKFIELAEACIKIKRAVVSRDPKENGLRRILNVGHTVGHALESVNNYDKSHGEYVLMGMLTECAMFKEYVESCFFAELTSMLKAFVVPPKTAAGAVIKAAMSDKKNDGGGICVMLPANAGDIREFMISRDEFRIRYERAVKEMKCAG